MTSPPIGTDEELIERLQATADHFEQFPLDNTAGATMLNCREAADALQSRIAEVERLREALQRCAWLAEMESGQLAIDVADVARAALSQHRTTG